MGGNPAIRQKSIKGSGVADLGGVRGEAVTQSDSGCDRWLHRLAAKPVGPRVVACLTQAGTADSVPKWIDAVVLNPAD
jgi:hypothetical protein